MLGRKSLDLLFIGVFLFSLYIILYVSVRAPPESTPSTSFLDDRELLFEPDPVQGGTVLSGCRLPRVDPWDGSFFVLYEKQVKDCNRSAERYGMPLEVRDGRIVVVDEKRCPLPVKHQNAYDKLSPKFLKTINDPITSEYTYIVCRDRQEYYITKPTRNEKLVTDIKAKRSYNNTPRKPINILGIGFDSMSHANYIRSFPKTMAYLRSFYNKSGTFLELNGYTIVGDGTTQNLGGILFGHMESQLYEARNRMKGAKTVDDWPWVWHNASKEGYLTGYYEDEPDLGAFTLRLKGFKNNPTNYYITPFWRNQRRKVTFSRSGVWDWERQLDFALDVFDTYPDLPIFTLVFTKVTHNDCLSFAKKLDDLVLERFKRIFESPYFDDTLIFLFGDHGPRYGVTRVTLQGKLEERLPGMFIKMPTWIAQDHPEILENLRNNQNVLTTPFDIYQTLQHAITFPQAPPPSTFRQSLFEYISPNRTCQEASIGEHWCTCTSRSSVAINELVTNGAQKLIEKINHKLTLNGEDLCLPIELKQIMTAEVSLYSDELLSFSGSGDADGRKPKFGAVNKTQTYQIQFEVSPGGGIFEGDFRATQSKQGVTIDAGDNFSRLNAYGELPCNPKPLVREYCVCK